MSSTPHAPATMGATVARDDAAEHIGPPTREQREARRRDAIQYAAAHPHLPIGVGREGQVELLVANAWSHARGWGFTVEDGGEYGPRVFESIEELVHAMCTAEIARLRGHVNDQLALLRVLEEALG